MTQDAAEPEGLKRSTACMRRSRQKELAAGYRRASVALSPASLDVIERIKENFAALDVKHTDDEVEKISALTKDNGRIGPDPKDCDF